MTSSSLQRGSDCYLAQLRTKAEWVRKNRDRIATALATEQDYPDSVVIDQIVPMFVTYYPSVACMFFDEFPCVSIVQLMEEYCVNGNWL